jgi:regulatory protein
MPDKDDVEEAIAVGLRLLSRREHSRRELRRKLRDRGHGSAVIEVVLERLTTSGALDEQRFMQILSRHRRGQGYGRQRVRAELREHGLASERIDVVLAEENGDWVAAAAKQATKYGLRGERMEDSRRLLVAHLTQRGFSRDEALDAVERAIAEASIGGESIGGAEPR